MANLRNERREDFFSRNLVSFIWKISRCIQKVKEEFSLILIFQTSSNFLFFRVIVFGASKVKCFMIFILKITNFQHFQAKNHFALNFETTRDPDFLDTRNVKLPRSREIESQDKTSSNTSLLVHGQRVTVSGKVSLSLARID